MDKKTALIVVNEMYSGAAGKTTAVDILLDKSKGTDGSGRSQYRPYYVAAALMLTEYRPVKKADVVEFFEYDKSAIQSILNMQVPLDSGLTVPPGYGTDDLLSDVSVSPGDKSYYSDFFTLSCD